MDSKFNHANVPEFLFCFQDDKLIVVNCTDYDQYPNHLSEIDVGDGCVRLGFKIDQFSTYSYGNSISYEKNCWLRLRSDPSKEFEVKLYAGDLFEVCKYTFFINYLLVLYCFYSQKA